MSGVTTDTTNTDTPPISAVMDAIARYCLARSWAPVGYRTFNVGPWTVTINGTREPVDSLPPYHAQIVHRDIVAIMVVSPFGGTVGGWCDTEDAFLRDISAVLAQNTAEASP